MTAPTPDAPTGPAIPPLVMAPLLGVTNATFRRVWHRHFTGVDRALSPFIPTTHGRPPHRRYYKDVLPENNRDSLPLVPQLIGKDGHDFREIANVLHDDLGYGEVNWNLGCPAATITSRGRGAGLLPHPDRVDAFLEAACTGLRCRLSVKMRVGMERGDEALALAEVLNRYPVAEVTIHPRTARQQYGGRADPDRFADLKALLRHPVAYNGDIDSPAAAASICARFPDLSSLMIGRALVAYPWLPAAIRAGRPGPESFATAALARFHDDLYEAYRAALEGGAGPVLARMKEVWTYWEADLPDVRRVLKARSLADYEAAVARSLAGGVVTCTGSGRS